MPASPPEPLRSLLRADAEVERDAAWGTFLREYSRLILHTARRAAEDEDDVMDRYAYVLERLREDDFRRLRSFSLNGSGKLSTWLVVVVRRLCIDHHRRSFGRQSGDPEDPTTVARQMLAGRLSGGLDPANTPEPSIEGADEQLLRSERDSLLGEALSGLSHRDQLLLTLRYVDGYSPRKVAKMLGYPSRFAVRRRVKTVLDTLRRDLDGRGFER